MREHDDRAGLTLEQCSKLLGSQEMAFLRSYVEDLDSNTGGGGAGNVFIDLGHAPGLTPDDADYFRQHPKERSYYRPITDEELKATGKSHATDVLAYGPLTWRKRRVLLCRVVRSR